MAKESFDKEFSKSKEDIVFEKDLWSVANELRGAVAENQYKDYIRSRIFLKHISERCETHRIEGTKGKKRNKPCQGVKIYCKSVSLVNFQNKIRKAPTCGAFSFLGMRRNNPEQKPSLLLIRHSFHYL